MAAEHILFPVQMNATWQTPESANISDTLRNWLLDPKSLTARLKQHCQQFRVELLGQEISTCSAAEANEDIAVDEPALVREVLLYCDNVAQVFARSLLPLASLTGEQQQLAHLGTQSLGQVLFNHLDLERKKIEVATFLQGSTVAGLAQHLSLKVTEPMWGRRSVFILNAKPLMVAEVFLPSAFAYQE